MNFYPFDGKNSFERTEIYDYGQGIRQNDKKCISAVSENQNIINAFWTGGLICTIGQALNTFYTEMGFSEDEVNAGVSVTLIVTAACLTGLGVYDKIAKVAGAGTIVPITGFANSIVSPAMEFSAEGKILGTGAKLFSLAGPVIAYGTLAAFIYGIICYCFKLY